METIPPQVPPIEQPTPPAGPQVWSLGLTFLWTLVVILIFFLFQTVVFFIMAAVKPDAPEVSTSDLLSGGGNFMEDLIALQYDGFVIGWTVVIASILSILVAALFIRMKKGSNLKHYLNLQAPKIKDVGIWVGIAVAYVLLVGFLESSSDSDALSSDMMNQIMISGDTWVLILGIGILGPIWEEVFFRGFIFKGIEQSNIGGHAAVAITSLIFVAIHLQYSLEILFIMLPLALILGYARYYSQSLWVPIIIHILNNTAQVIIVKSTMV